MRHLSTKSKILPVSLWASLTTKKYLDNILQDFLADDGFVARRFLVQVHHHLQGALGEGHVV